MASGDGISAHAYKQVEKSSGGVGIITTYTREVYWARYVDCKCSAYQSPIDQQLTFVQGV